MRQQQVLGKLGVCWSNVNVRTVAGQEAAEYNVEFMARQALSLPANHVRPSQIACSGFEVRGGGRRGGVLHGKRIGCRCGAISPGHGPMPGDLLSGKICLNLATAVVVRDPGNLADESWRRQERWLAAKTLICPTMPCDMTDSLQARRQGQAGSPSPTRLT